MYLKSLVLKGFKSFADRSVLSVEPGITAIVGPNGSGKSNISDAVLWVLGERSAKSLRGQAMEDIIFAGSAARKAVSVAEVELVLDNSDGTLPVDYDEVSIARRMYRSGESEYLVNGVVARRLDVLDILHDSGLGTGTHSIISQGSLDSILQSKPEDRRALVEEAAGVLKHKQRKEKAARKLESMDAHLERVRDVTAEVERQLKPLERKAKRAEAYKEAKSKLTDLKLTLAVDDLRSLQSQWDRICEEEKACAESLEAKRLLVDDAERKVSVIQDTLHRESVDAGELARRQRRTTQVGERLDSCERVLRERRRSTIDYQANLQMSLNSNASRSKTAERELEAARKQCEEARSRHEASQGTVAELSALLKALEDKRSGAESAVEQMRKDARQCERDLSDAQRKRAAMQETLSNELAREKVVDARRHELLASLDKLKDAHGEAARALKAADEKLAALQREDEEVQTVLLECFERQEKARARRDEARESVKLLDAELKAVERERQAERSGNPSLSWLAENAEAVGVDVAPVVSSVKAPASLELLVERLLGEDVSALATKRLADSNEVATALLAQSLQGDVSLVAGLDDASIARVRARNATAGTPLVDLLEYDENARGVIEALFGDVVVCEDRESSFAAHASDTAGLRFVSKDGTVVWPSGKVRVFGKRAREDEGVLARERKREELQQKLEQARADELDSIGACERAEEAYREAQAHSLKVSQELAAQKGARASALAEEQGAAKRLASSTSELEDITRQAEKASLAVSDLRPQMDEVERIVEELELKREELAKRREELEGQANPLREEAADLSGKLTSARLEEATLSERKTYAERMVIARENDRENIRRSRRRSRRSLAEKTIAIERAAQAIQIVELLAAELQRKARVLDDAIAASEDASNSVHERATLARNEARQAHDDYDAASERMTQVRVEKSRLEIQVDAAVRAVVVDCATPLDIAQQLPTLEDRRAAEDEAFKVERRIKNMGAINPDAAEEYAELKQRYDYLAGQLADMEMARRSLNRIVRVIDARMKDDFERTFNQVNENFGEIFSTLFPGGSAHIELVDPDDVESSGVEVVAQPRGKRLAKMMLMSGGEKSLTALALLFAVYKTRSTPFYILDEVEAALDDTNLRRLVGYIDELRASTQLIMITHQRRTMEMADVLFGVSMQADGVTKVISQKLDRALEHAE